MFESYRRYYFNSFVLQKRTVIAKRRKTQQPFTGVAQRQRAWLITTRTQDRDLSPVLLHFGSFTEAVTHSTGVAQRLARRAHNPEVVCSNHTAGIISIRSFYRSEPS